MTRRLPPVVLLVLGTLLLVAAAAAEAVVRPVSATQGWSWPVQPAFHLACLGALSGGAWWVAVGWTRGRAGAATVEERGHHTGAAGRPDVGPARGAGADRG